MAVQEKASDYLKTKGFADYKDKMSSVIPPIVGAKGENSFQYNPDNKDGAYNKAVDPKIQEVLDEPGLKNDPRATAELKLMIEKDQAATKKDVASHIVQQTYYSNIANHDSLITSLQKNIPSYKTIDSIKLNRDKMDETVSKRLAIQGKQATSEDQIVAFNQSYDHQVIKYMTSVGNIQGAKDYAKHVESWGDTVPASSQQEIYKAGTRQDAENWYRAQSTAYKTSDGKPDITTIMSHMPKGLTQDQQDIYTKTIMPKYHLDTTQVNSNHSDLMNQFKGVLSKNPNSSDILKEAKRLSWDGASYDAMLKLASNPKHGSLIINMGGGKANELQNVHHNIYQGIMEGRVDQTQLLSLFNKGVLDNNSFDNGQKFLDSINKTGVNAGKANFSRSVRREIDDAYAGDPDKGTEFTREFYKHLSDNPDATTADLRKYVEENLKPAPKDPVKFWNMLQQENTSDQPGPAEQTMKATVGASTLSGIQTYLRASNPSNFMPTEQLHDYMRQLHATMDDMAVGQPINNAIQSVLEWNKIHPDQPHSLKPELILKISQEYPGGMAF